MKYIYCLLASLAAIPVFVYGSSVDSSALYSLLCVALIAGSLFIMFPSENASAPRS